MLSKEEAEQRGLPVQPSSNSMKHRQTHHDYNMPGTYMITIEVQDRKPLLGTIMQNPATSQPYVKHSELGEKVLFEHVPMISKLYPMVEVWRTCVMPDHVHLIVRVKAEMPEGKTLGNAIRGLKGAGSRTWWELSGLRKPEAKQPGTKEVKTKEQDTCPIGQGTRAEAQECISQAKAPASTPSPASALAPSPASASAPSPALVPAPTGAVPNAAPGPAPKRKLPSLFAPGYNDKILKESGQLERWKHYLDDNPRRLFLKRKHRDLFTVRRDYAFKNYSLQLIGNQFLLDYPDKVAVIFSRKYTAEQYEQLKAEWLACGERGGVLISAAIHPEEKAIMKEAFARGWRCVKIHENGFSELYKPIGRSFNACIEGRLLEISPWAYHADKPTIKRDQCLALNELARAIAAWS